MSSNEHNKKDDKKDSACEINNKLVHGTPRRRKIIRAKRPPMSKTPKASLSSAVVSDEAAIVTPQANAGVDTSGESSHPPAINTSALNSLMGGTLVGLDLDDVGDLIKEDSAKLQQKFRQGVNDPRFKEIVSN